MLADAAGLSLADTTGVAKALGHPARLRLLAMLRHGPLCPCQMTAVLKVAPSTISQHLVELRRAGLVGETRRGRWVQYRLLAAGPFVTLLGPTLALLRDDPAIARDAALARRLRRVPLEVLCRAGLDLEAVGAGRPVRATRRKGGRA